MAGCNNGVPMERVTLRVLRTYDRICEENTRLRTILQTLRLSDFGSLIAENRRQRERIDELQRAVETRKMAIANQNLEIARLRGRIIKT